MRKVVEEEVEVVAEEVEVAVVEASEAVSVRTVQAQVIDQVQIIILKQDIIHPIAHTIVVCINGIL